MGTKEIVAGMMVEYTGRHMLDSGGAYGRNFERNQGRDFENEKRCIINFRWGMDVTINLYHWIKEKLEHDPEMQDLYDYYASESKESYLADMEGFHEFLNELHGHTRKKDGYRIEFSENSYNHDNLLSQTIQYTILCHPDEEPIVLLQVHGGCDVRGGYTAPKVFRCGSRSEDWFDFVDYRSATIYCNNRECLARWRTDDAYHWYAESYDCQEDFKDLDKYDQVKHEEKHGDAEITAPTKGIIYVDEDHNGWCPVCAGSVLGADWY